MAHQHSPRFLKIVQDAKARVREVTVDQVKAKLDGGDLRWNKYRTGGYG